MGSARAWQGHAPSGTESGSGSGLAPRERTREKRRGPVATVVDLFCGAGAFSHGFLQEGFAIAGGYDIDEACRYPYEENNKAPLVCRDVSAVRTSEVNACFAGKSPRILIGGAPCQPYSRYARGRSNPKWMLLADFARLAAKVAPDIVAMENVPQLLRFDRGRTYREFLTTLERAGYTVQGAVLNCSDFGVPQSRMRLVVIGSRHGTVPLPERTHCPDDYRTVGETIRNLPAIEAGGADAADILHCASIMSPLNLRRIRASRPGGTWRDWPLELVADCHRKRSGQKYDAIYGRMQWEQQAPTITTKFTGFGNGRFGHPEQDRALSLREGALLQAFPQDYAFVRPTERLYITRVRRMIGNAVPVAMARAVARAVKRHLGA